VRFQLPRALRNFETLDCTLRCVEEAYETRGECTQVVCYALYQDEQKLPEKTVGREVALSFPLPPTKDEAGDEIPPTALSKRPATYWELEIHAETPGIDYKGLFLLPVYA